MPTMIRIDDLIVSVDFPAGRPVAEVRAATRALTRGGFVPRLRKLARNLARDYPALRRAAVRVGR